MCSWAKTFPVCQSISLQNETCGTPGKVGWCLVCSGFILIFYTCASWFCMFFFCQWMGDFAIQTSENWDFGVLTSIPQLFSPFLFFTYYQRFGSYENVQIWAEINCISDILFAGYILPVSCNYFKEIIFFIFHWVLPVLILEILEESSTAGYVLSAKVILILGESLAPEKLRRNIYTNWVPLKISYSVSTITFR